MNDSLCFQNPGFIRLQEADFIIGFLIRVVPRQLLELPKIEIAEAERFGPIWLIVPSHFSLPL
jgi:hypothetical protein